MPEGGAAIAGPLAPATSDDCVLPFQAERSGVMGRIVRLGPAVDEVLNRHDYPDAVSQVLGEALALTAMVGTTLKANTKLILQAQTDGPVRLLVAQFDAPGNMRGYARFDETRVNAAHEDGSQPSDRAHQVLGKGHFALTIDPGNRMDQYQGIVTLDGGSLTHAAHEYFRSSVQLPTFIKLAVAKHYSASRRAGTEARLGAATGQGTWQWRAGGLMVQLLSREGGLAVPGLVAAQPITALADDDGWERTRILAATAEDHELLDPLLAPERLLFRLFHEEGVRVFDTRPLTVDCHCSRTRVARMFQLFSPNDITDMSETDGSISVTCEFCNTTRRFDRQEIAAARLLHGGN